MWGTLYFQTRIGKNNLISIIMLSTTLCRFAARHYPCVGKLETVPVTCTAVFCILYSVAGWKVGQLVIPYVNIYIRKSCRIGNKGHCLQRGGGLRGIFFFGGGVLEGIGQFFCFLFKFYTKESSLCYKHKYTNSYIFAT